MSTRRTAVAKRNTNGGELKNNGESAPSTTEEQVIQAEQVNAVVVHRLKADDGSIRCVAEPIGDVMATEIPTILDLAKKEFMARIGI